MAALSGIESSAKDLLTRAVELDGARRFTEALVCYQEGTHLLINVLKGVTDSVKKEGYRKKIAEFLDHAEKLKAHIEKEKEAGKYHEQIQIEDNSSGHSYEKVFTPFIDDNLRRVVIEDPYIRAHHQILNLVRFCEALVKHAKQLKAIHLLTSADSSQQSHSDQQSKLNELTFSLQKHGIKLTVEYSSSLHDREIRFDTGWIIKIGRGLDYFKPATSKFAIGVSDYDLRHCHQTTIDIVHRKNVTTKS